jgi:hypothetical protein
MPSKLRRAHPALPLNLKVFIRIIDFTLNPEILRYLAIEAVSTPCQWKVTARENRMAILAGGWPILSRAGPIAALTSKA